MTGQIEICHQKTDTPIYEAQCEWQIAKHVFEAIKDPVTLTSKKFFDPKYPEIKWKLKLFEVSKNTIQCCALCFNIPQNMAVYLKPSLVFGRGTKPVESPKFSKSFLIFKVDVAQEKRYESCMKNGFLYMKLTLRFWIGHSKELVKPLRIPQPGPHDFNLQRTLKGGQTVPYDVPLKGKDGVVVEAHKIVLCAASSVFRALLDNKPSGTIITIPDFDSTTIQKMVDSLYGEAVNCHHDLFKIAHTYEILELKNYYSVVLQKQISIENATDFFNISIICNDISLKQKCSDFIKTNLNQVMSSQRFREFDAEQTKAFLDELMEVNVSDRHNDHDNNEPLQSVVSAVSISSDVLETEVTEITSSLITSPCVTFVD